MVFDHLFVSCEQLSGCYNFTLVMQRHTKCLRHKRVTDISQANKTSGSLYMALPLNDIHKDYKYTTY
jgi:hypothetical protein